MDTTRDYYEDKIVDFRRYGRGRTLYRCRKGSITPPDIKTKIKWHYTLFREAEKMNPVSSFVWMCINILGNSYKKIFYVKKV